MTDHDASLPDNWYWVGPSSIISGETKAMGLYSLYNIKKGTLLPGCYYGSQIRTDDYTRLVDEVEDWGSAMINIYGDEISQKNDRIRKEQQFIDYLQKKYQLTIVGNLSERFPDWAKISKGLTDYSYEGEDIPLSEDESSSDGQYTSKTMLTILPVYDFDGKYIYDDVSSVKKQNSSAKKQDSSAKKQDIKIQKNFFCFANEPPATETFYNKLTKRDQKSRVNISAVLPSNLPASYKGPHRNFIHFRASADIEAGDELFLCYGASYARSYEMNMTSETGCGCYAEVSGYLTNDMEKETYETIVETFGHVPKNIMTKAAQDDKRVREYFSKIHPPPKKKRRRPSDNSYEK
jgi:hypothetical protein